MRPKVRHVAMEPRGERRQGIVFFGRGQTIWGTGESTYTDRKIQALQIVFLDLGQRTKFGEQLAGPSAP